MDAYTFGASKPRSVVVSSTPTLISLTRNLCVLFISNYSTSTPIYLGFTEPEVTTPESDQCAVQKGIAIFPQTTYRFDNTAFPYNVKVWAVAEQPVTVGIQY